MAEGKLLVLEGIDGSGKATQAAMLLARLQGEGRAVQAVSFPNYDSPSSALIKMYLGGELGDDLRQINPYAASIFYAADRYVSFVQQWGDFYRQGGILLADRYATSNATHQMSRLPREEWEGYLRWLQDLEYDRMGLPAPSLVVYLDMHPQVAQKLMAKRYRGDETRKDLHEADAAYLCHCREAALFAAQFCGWQVVRCFAGEEPLPPETIAQAVYELVSQRL